MQPVPSAEKKEVFELGGRIVGGADNVCDLSRFCRVFHPFGLRRQPVLGQVICRLPGLCLARVDVCVNRRPREPSRPYAVPCPYSPSRIGVSWHRPGWRDTWAPANEARDRAELVPCAEICHPQACLAASTPRGLRLQPGGRICGPRSGHADALVPGPIVAVVHG